MIELGLSTDLQDLVENRWRLREMVDSLASAGARDAALETANVASRIAQLDVWAESACRRLSRVWLAFDPERCSGEDSRARALKKYRGE